MTKLRPWVLTLGVLLVLPWEAAQAGPPGIRAFDWADFHYPKDADTSDGDTDPAIVLHNGRSRPTSPDDIEISRLTAVRYADFLGDGRTEAAVEIVTPVVARRQEDDNVYVFEWRAGRPRQIFFRRYDAGARMRVAGRSLVILVPDGLASGPVHWTRTVLRWRGGAFRAAPSAHAPSPR